MAQPLQATVTPAETKMADAELQNGHMTNGNDFGSPPAVNGTNGVNVKSLPAELLDLASGSGSAVSPPNGTSDAKSFDPLTPDVVSQSSSVPSEPTTSSGGALIDLDPLESLQEASTASLTPASPPADGASSLDGFESSVPELATAEAVQKDTVTLFGNTGNTLEELGVFSAPPPPANAEPAVTTNGDAENKPETASKPEAPSQHNGTDATAEPPSPASPSKKNRESKLPKMTPPASPKKKPSETVPQATSGSADDNKLFEKVPLPQEVKPAEPSGGARPKTAPPKQPASPKTPRSAANGAPAQKAAEEERPQTAPSKIPSPKKERTPVSTPKKQDVASDSGIEDDKVTSPRSRTPGTEKKRYGIDSKNTTYKPSGGNVKIFEKKLDVKSVGARIDNKPSPKKADGSPRTRPGAYVPPEMPKSKKITETIKTMTPSPNTKLAASKVGSLSNAKHTPGGGNVKIVTKKEDFSTVSSKCGSTANIKHTPGGGNKKIEQRKLEWNAQSKVGSLEKATHKPGGGDKKIESQKLNWSVQSKVGSLDNATHKAGGGEKKIESHKVEFRDKAKSKVGSTKNLKHVPGGGDKTIETHKVDFRDKATARTKHGVSPAKVAEAAANST